MQERERERAGGRERYTDREINSNKSDKDRRRLREICAMKARERQTDWRSVMGGAAKEREQCEARREGEVMSSEGRMFVCLRCHVCERGSTLPLWSG